jgi:hypothetical protein
MSISIVKVINVILRYSGGNAVTTKEIWDNFWNKKKTWINEY